jgi:hypothetical protein
MNATEKALVTLAEFGPEKVWFAAVGTPMGLTLDLVHGEDDSTGEAYQRDPAEAESMLPERWWDLEGTVSEDGGEWTWNIQDDPRDWRQNTVTRLVAYRSVV